MRESAPRGHEQTLETARNPRPRQLPSVQFIVELCNTDLPQERQLEKHVIRYCVNAIQDDPDEDSWAPILRANERFRIDVALGLVAARSKKVISINCRVLGGNVVQVFVKRCCTVADLKEGIAVKVGHPVISQSMMFCGKHVEDAHRLSQLGIRGGATVEVFGQPGGRM
jgi:Ubiquitin family